jgi:PAS domain S-box-containing protein
MNKILIPDGQDVYRNIVEYSFHGIMLIDNDSAFADANPEACNILGYSKDELLNMKIEDIVPHSNLKTGRKLWQDLLNKGKQKGEYQLFRKDGKKIVVGYVAIANVSHDLHLFVINDITKNKKAEKDLRLSEERYHAIVQDQTELICRFTPDGTITFVNDALCKYYLKKREDLIGVNYLRYISDHIIKDIEHELTLFSKDRPIFSYDNYITLSSGEKRWQQWVLRALFDESDNIIEFQAVGRDNTEQKQTEEKLNEALTIINKSRSVAFTWKNAGGWPVEFVSENVEKLFEYNAEDFTSGKVSYASCIHPDDLKRVSQEVEKYSNEKDRTEFEHAPYRIITKLGQIKFVSDWSFIVRNPEGIITHYKGIVEDITERKEAEDRLRSTNKQLEGIIEFLPDATFIIDKDKRIRAWNRAMEEMTGIPKEDILGKDRSYGAIPFYGKQRAYLIDLIFEPDPEIYSKYDFIKQKGNSFYVEVFTPALYNNKGAYVWAIASPLLDADGNVTGAIESIRDTNEQKRTEKDLVESEEKLKGILAAAPIGINLIQNRKFVWSNDMMSEITGYSMNEIIEKNTRFLYLSDEGYEKAGYDYNSKFAKGKIAEVDTKWRRKNGKIIDIHKKMCLLDSNDISKGYITSVMDVTELKKADEKLMASEEKYRTLFEDSKNPIWTTSREGIILDANQATADLLGYLKDELIGLDVYSLYVDPSHRKIFQDEIEEKGFVKNFQSQWITKDGRQLDLLFDFTLWKDNDGKIIGYRGIAEDVTLINRSQKQLGENLEYFAHLVDHIRNPLAILSGFTQVEIENEKTKDRLMRQIDRIEEIIKQLDQGWMDTEDTRKFMKRYM